MNRYNRWWWMGCCCVAMLLAGCDVTKTLPEGQQLYMGVKQLRYVDDTSPATAHHDSVGVIGAISAATAQVKQALQQGEKTTKDSGAQQERKVAAADKAVRKREARITKEAVSTAKDEVEAVLLAPPNGSLFGSAKYRTPFNPGLWVYAGFYDHKTAFGKWFFKVFSKSPKLVTSIAPRTRAKVAQGELFNHGFMRGRVAYDVVPLKNKKKAYINYRVKMGQLWRNGFVRYQGFTSTQDSLLRATWAKRLVVSGNAFNAGQMEAERNRITQLFRENGYYFWRNDYSVFLADTSRHAGEVDLKIAATKQVAAAAKKRWKFGKTYVRILRDMEDELGQKEGHSHFTFYYSGKNIPIRPSLWQRAVMYESGEMYSLSKERQTLAKLNRMNIFQQLDINYVPHDTLGNCDTLDVYINGVLDKPYNSDLEMNATFKSNQQVGPGLSYSINKKNALRGGENLSLKLYGSYEWQLTSGAKSGSSALNSYELGSQLSLSFPRLLVPFVKEHRLKFPAETKYAADFDWKKRSSFFTMISAGVSANYTWNKYKTTTHLFTPLSLEFDKVTNRSFAFDSITQANPALYISMRNQFIPAIGYTYTYASAPTHRNPVWVQASIKEAGNLLSCGYAVGKHPFDRKNKKLFATPFAQFLKTTVEWRTLFDLGHKWQLATRLYGGAIWSYGNSVRSPYSEQFYVGGANSVRGFTVRTIGPGGYRSDDSKYSYIDQTGDIRLEANAELRFPLFGNLYGATFVDAGNVWLMRADSMRPEGKLDGNTLKKIAVSTGAGLRYDLGILVLRLDLGVALHAPYKTAKKGFYNIEKLKDGLNLHFAIGYPF